MKPKDKINALCMVAITVAIMSTATYLCIYMDALVSQVRMRTAMEIILMSEGFLPEEGMSL